MATLLKYLEPYSYPYAGLSTRPLASLDQTQLDALRQWWTQEGLDAWIPTPPPSSVSCRILIYVCLLSPPVWELELESDLSASLVMILLCRSHWQPSEIRFVCCAVFLVSRERILAHPRDFYAHLLHWLITTVRWMSRVAELLFAMFPSMLVCVLPGLPLLLVVVLYVCNHCVCYYDGVDTGSPQRMKLPRGFWSGAGT